MRLYLSHSSGYDYKSELYEPLQNTLGKEKEYDIFYPHETREDGMHAKDIIADCDAVLAEVSFPSTGQGIELGWADFQDKPIICICRPGTHVSSAIRFICDTVIEYSSSEDMVQKLRFELSRLGIV